MRNNVHLFWQKPCAPDWQKRKLCADFFLLKTLNGNVSVVLLLRNCTVFSTFPFQLLHALSGRDAGIVLQIFAATGPWSCVDNNVSAERLKGTELLESVSLPGYGTSLCPAAVRAGWCKGICVPRPLLVSTVINSSIFFSGTCTPSLIFLIDETIIYSLFHFW